MNAEQSKELEDSLWQAADILHLFPFDFVS